MDAGRGCPGFARFPFRFFFFFACRVQHPSGTGFPVRIPWDFRCGSNARSSRSICFVGVSPRSESFWTENKREPSRTLVPVYPFPALQVLKRSARRLHGSRHKTQGARLVFCICYEVLRRALFPRPPPLSPHPLPALSPFALPNPPAPRAPPGFRDVDHAALLPGRIPLPGARRLAAGVYRVAVVHVGHVLPHVGVQPGVRRKGGVRAGERASAF